MIPSRPSLPRIISRTLGPVDVLGTGRTTSVPDGVDDAEPAREVGDVAVLVGLHARRAGRDPAAERRVGEGVGEVAEGPALGVELALELRPERAGLHLGEPRLGVDREHAVHPAHVDRDHGARLVRPAPRGCREMFEPPPNGITTASAVERGGEHGRDLSSSPGRTTQSGRRPTSPAAVAHQVAQALAARVDDAVHRVGGDVRRRRRPPSRRSDSAGVQARRASMGTSANATGAPWPARCPSRGAARMNGRSAGLSASLNAVVSSPHPHHFMMP